VRKRTHQLQGQAHRGPPSQKLSHRHAQVLRHLGLDHRPLCLQRAGQLLAQRGVLFQHAGEQRREHGVVGRQDGVLLQARLEAAAVVQLPVAFLAPAYCFTSGHDLLLGEPALAARALDEAQLMPNKRFDRRFLFSHQPGVKLGGIQPQQARRGLRQLLHCFVAALRGVAGFEQVTR
jgi:hypothetical protein